MAAGMNGARGPVFKPMDLGELLDHSFRVFRKGWRSLITIGLIAAIPSVISTGITRMMSPASTSPWARMFNYSVDNNTNMDLDQLMAIGGLATLMGFVSLLAYPLVQGAVIVVCSRTYLGYETSPKDALRASLGRYPALLGTMILAGLMPLVAFVILVIVATVLGVMANEIVMIILMVLMGLLSIVGLCAYAVYVIFSNHAVVVERESGGFRAIRRSFKLVSGRFWPLVGLGIVFSLMLAIVGGMAGFLAVMPVTVIELITGPNFATAWVAAILAGLVTAVTSPFYMVGLTLAYYDTRMRKEGFDLEMLAQSQVAEPEQL